MPARGETIAFSPFFERTPACPNDGIYFELQTSRPSTSSDRDYLTGRMDRSGYYRRGSPSKVTAGVNFQIQRSGCRQGPRRFGRLAWARSVSTRLSQ